VTIPASRIEHAIVTGATEPGGRAAVLALLDAGLAVTLVGRSPERLQAEADALVARGARADVLVADLASLASIREAAARFLVRHGSWRVLLDLARVAGVPERTLTDDGFEWHLGVNHLAHFALTGLLLPGAARRAAVVSVTSSGRAEAMRFHDLRFDHGYRPARALAQSDLAQLLFARELDRRCRSVRTPAYPSGVTSVAIQTGRQAGRVARRLGRRLRADARAVGCAAAELALADHTRGGALYAAAAGADGSPMPRRLPDPRIADEHLAARRLWRISAQLTRISW
jgi:NAD(P)-dependent dehydrogenase (short-subunit alcohol dehydrogenase family)